MQKRKRSAERSDMADESDVFQTPCEERDSCRTYLLTYSQACLVKVPDCESFTNIVLGAFNEGSSTSQVVQWATCQEDHDRGGVHYHMILKLNRPRRWKPLFENIRMSHRICVNFSSSNSGYLAGYRYVIKNKNLDSVLHSRGHPDLSAVRSPKSKKGFQKFSQNAQKRRASANATVLPYPTTPNDPESMSTPNPQSVPEKRPRLTNSDVARFIVENDLHTEDDLLSEAKKRDREGLSDIHNFILNRNPKALSDLIAMTWKLHHAPEVAQRKTMDRMQVVLSYLDKPSVAGCNGAWIEAAREVLVNNDINLYVFADAIRKCLRDGRNKFNNILLVGTTNCAKSFLINPLEDMFKCFTSPTPGRYAWVGHDECELALIQDLRWSDELIKWNDFLLLLEGQTVHLARPKNLFSTDLTIHKSNKLPFFATTKEPMEYFNRINITDDK